MAFFRRRHPKGPLELHESANAPGEAPRSIVAAAVPLSGPGVRRVDQGRQRQTQEQWQREAWYYFDVVGEARGPLMWIANAVSQADVHATEIDAETGKPTGPSDDPRAMAAASQVLGGPSKRSGLLRLIALCWQVPGEAWIIVRPTRAGDPDEWLVLSGNKVQAKGTAWSYTDPFNGNLVTLTKSDRLIRNWNPHPDDQAKADSAMRPALPICREIEKSSQNIAARLDSRIATNGIGALAEELDFPRGDYETSAQSFAAEFLTTAEYGLQNPGQASSQVPLFFTAPGELIANGGAFAHFDISTEFDGQVVELRQDALRRLAATLDMPKDVAEGTQGEANHWSAWQVEESTYKIFIEPLLKAVGDVLTEYWYRPALIAMGMTEEQAAGFELGWDTTAIVARPDDRETLESLYDKILISDAYMLAESGVPEDAMPAPDERTRRLLEKIILSGAPASLLADPNVAEAIGLEVEIQPVAAGVDAEVTAGDELEAPEPEPTNVRALPGTRGQEPEAEAVPEGLVAAAELIVYDALSRAGGRLLTNQNRGQFKAVPRHELHTVIAAHDDNTLLEGSFQFTDKVADAFGLDRFDFRETMRGHVVDLFDKCAAHDRILLRRQLRALL